MLLLAALLLASPSAPTLPAQVTGEEEAASALRDLFDSATLAIQHEDFATALHRLKQASAALQVELNMAPTSRANLQSFARWMGLASSLPADRIPAVVELLRELLVAVPELAEEPQGLDARAFVAASAGDLGAVSELQRRIVAIYEERHPEDHPLVERSRAKLAKTMWTLGQLQESAELWQKVALTRARRLGAEHEDTLVALGNLAIAVQALGDLDTAQRLGERVLAVREKKLDDDDERVLRARSFVGLNLGMLGELPRARDLLESVHQAYADRPPSIEAIDAASDLAALALEMGDLDAAVELERAALARALELFGESHGEVLRVRTNLATALQSAGQAGEARDHFRTVLSALEEQRPEGHPEVAAARNALGTTLVAMGEFGEARALFEDALERLRSSLPADHSHLRDLRRNIAVTYVRQERWKEALPHLEAVAAWFESKLPVGDPQRLLALQELRETLVRAGLDTAAVDRRIRADTSARPR